MTEGKDRQVELVAETVEYLSKFRELADEAGSFQVAYEESDEWVAVGLLVIGEYMADALRRLEHIVKIVTREGYGS